MANKLFAGVLWIILSIIVLVATQGTIAFLVTDGGTLGAALAPFLALAVLFFWYKASAWFCKRFIQPKKEAETK